MKKGLVPHSEQEWRDHEIGRRYQEFSASFMKLVPFVSPNGMQRLIASSQARERLEEVLEAFFFLDAAGLIPSERDRSLVNLLAAYWAGWKIRLYQPRMLRVDSIFLPDLEKFFGYQVKVLKKEPGSLFSGPEGRSSEIDLQKIVFGSARGEKPLLVSDIQGNAKFTGRPPLGLWLGLALWNEEGQGSLRWLRDTKGVEQMSFLGTTLEGGSTLSPFVITFVHLGDNKWERVVTLIDTVFSKKMRFPVLDQNGWMSDEG